MKVVALRYSQPNDMHRHKKLYNFQIIKGFMGFFSIFLQDDS